MNRKNFNRAFVACATGFRFGLSPWRALADVNANSRPDVRVDRVILRNTSAEAKRYAVDVSYSSNGWPAIYLSPIGAVETPGTASFVTDRSEIQVSALSWSDDQFQNEVNARSQPVIRNLYSINIEDQIEYFRSIIETPKQSDALELAKAYYGLGYDETALATLAHFGESKQQTDLKVIEAQKVRAQALVKLGHYDLAISNLLDIMGDAVSLGAAFSSGSLASVLAAAAALDTAVANETELGWVQRLAGLYRDAQATYDGLKTRDPESLERGALAVAYRINAFDVLSQTTADVV
jgi:tetratricopeptide (TPR) repeat protein